MAELLYVHLLITVTVSAGKKREIIGEVLGWLPSPPSIPDDLMKGLAYGLVNPGTFYATGRERCITFLVRFGESWTALGQTDRSAAMKDPWVFRDVVWSIEVGSAYSQRNALVHLAFPSVFEAITSDDHKRLLVDRFVEHIADPSANIDRQLVDIRHGLEPTHGQGFDYYGPTLERQWRAGGPGDWEAFVHWAAKFYESPTFDADERDYKLAIAARLARALEAFQSDDPDWVTELRRAFSNQNLTSWQAHDKFLKWVDVHHDEARHALGQIWGAAEPSVEAMKAFLDLIPAAAISGVGTRTSISSFLLLGRDPLAFPIYRPEPFKAGYELTGVKRPSERASEDRQYGAAVDFLERFMDEAAERDLNLRDLLDAQGLLWSVTKWPPLESWSAEQQKAFLAFRGEATPAAEMNPPVGGGEPAASSAVEVESLAGLERRLCLDEGALVRMVKLLSHRRQLVLQGPPGTGKTYVARALANHLAGGDGSVTLVQFHPSYTYEDFVEGYRPLPEGGFALRPGPLKRMAQLAAERPESTHVLLIDELNRGNLAKVFGELYFMLEYRTEQVSLQYSDEPFTLPPNLWIIGTMNTADRSIAIVDGALRRRFHFVDFYPDEPPVRDVLRRWLMAYNPEALWVADMVDRANSMLGDRHLAIGPSYFMKPDYDEEWIRLVWEHSVIPYLQEQLYGQEERLDDFRFDRLRSDLEEGGRAPGVGTPVPDDGPGDGAAEE